MRTPSRSSAACTSVSCTIGLVNWRSRLLRGVRPRTMAASVSLVSASHSAAQRARRCRTILPVDCRRSLAKSWWDWCVGTFCLRVLPRASAATSWPPMINRPASRGRSTPLPPVGVRGARRPRRPRRFNSARRAWQAPHDFSRITQTHKTPTIQHPRQAAQTCITTPVSQRNAKLDVAHEGTEQPVKEEEAGCTCCKETRLKECGWRDRNLRCCVGSAGDVGEFSSCCRDLSNGWHPQSLRLLLF
jgi:hypothetical protein